MTRISSLVAIACLSIAPALAFEKDTADPELAGGPSVGRLTFTVGGQIANVAYGVDALGNAVHQGDILLGPLQSVMAVPQGIGLMGLGEDDLFGLAIRGREFRWPNQVVKFRIDPTLSNPARVYSAMATWQAETGVVFEPAASVTENQIVFIPGDGCSSFIGMVGGPQPITLSDDCGVGNVIHEIGHALGLQHEQSREDHFEHVIVYRQNIVEGREGNFEPDPISYEDVGEYCYDSIMHYPSHAFSKDPFNLATIETVPPGIPIGQRSYLAECDKETYRWIYETANDPVAAQFDGVLELYPQGCQAERECYLRNDITFTDPNSIRWRAGKRDPAAGAGIYTGLTDGATIPGWAEWIIGEPYSEEYLLAAVVHDHYCYDENHVRGWRETHRMFYDALVALEVPALKAKIMYAAVYLGGPKWTDLVLGETCGPNCVFDAVSMQDAQGGELPRLYRSEQYDSAELQADLAGLATQLELDPTLSLAEIETMVQEIRPDDFFYRTPGELDVTK